MARKYTCPVCKQGAITHSQRGPTPRMCDTCKSDNDQPAPSLSGSFSRALAGLTRRQTAESVLYQDKMALALAMRVDYCTWEEIAIECGYSSPAVAAQAVSGAMSHRQVALNEALDHIRIRELYRLDKLSAKAMRVLEAEHPLVQAGRVVVRELENGTLQELEDAGPTLAAIDRLLKLSESRRKLLGLDAATKVENAVTVQYTVEGIAESDMP